MLGFTPYKAYSFSFEPLHFHVKNDFSESLCFSSMIKTVAFHEGGNIKFYNRVIDGDLI